MRPDFRSARTRAARALVAGVPAIAGSIALSLTAAPAHAAELRLAPSERAHGLAAPGGATAGDLRAFGPGPSSQAASGGSNGLGVDRMVANGVGIRVASRAAGIRVAAEVPPTYVVQDGDSVSAVAGRFGLRTADVLALNGLSWDASTIRPGQVLTLIGGAPSTPVAPDAPAAPAPAAGSYIVRAGDTVSAIAGAHGLSVQSVLDANGLDWSSVIYPGQALAIPGGSAPAPVEVAAPAAPAAPPAPAAPATGATYEVRAGDTISAIAAAHGTSIQAVLDANGLGWSAIIYPGQVLAVSGAPLAASLSIEPVAAVAPAVGLDAEQTANAQLIIRVGRDLGVSDRGIAIALGTAMQESWLRNLGWGDRDSLGLFQQRPSQGWGTADEIRNPERSIRVFYGGSADPNGSRTRGLLDIAGWEGMAYADAAQAVQISAYPDRYAQWEAPAFGWLAALG